MTRKRSAQERDKTRHARRPIAPTENNAGPSPVESLARWHRHADVAGGLAFARVDPTDFRPEVLAWFAGGDEVYAGRVFTYVAAGLVIRSAREGIALTQDSLNAAVGDAMAYVRTLRSPTRAKERAKEIGVREETFRTLRDMAIRTLWHGIREGSRNYESALGMRRKGRESKPGLKTYAGLKSSSKREESVNHQPSQSDDPLDRIDTLLAGDTLDQAQRAGLVITAFEVLAARYPNFAPGTVDEVLPSLYAGRIRGEAA